MTFFFTFKVNLSKKKLSLLDEPVTSFDKGSPTVSAMKEYKEGVAVREERDIRESVHDESESQVVEERGDLHQLCYGELLLLDK